MVAAKKWRLIGIETQTGGDLEMLELGLFNGTARMDAAATLSCSHAPVAGSLAALQDGHTAESCKFSGEAVESAGFWLQWEFPSEQEITSLQVTRASLATALSRASVQTQGAGGWTTHSTGYTNPRLEVFELSVQGPSNVGAYLASCAAVTAAGHDTFDPGDVGHPEWATRFLAFRDVGAYTAGGSVAPRVTTTIERFISGERWRVSASNASWFGDFAHIDIEFLSGSTVVAAVACRWLREFSNSVRVGATVSALGIMPNYGAYPRVYGVLVASNDGIRYTPDVGTTQDTNEFFYVVDLSAVNALRITVEAKENYHAGAAFGFLALLDGTGYYIKPSLAYKSPGLDVAASAPVPAHTTQVLRTAATVRDVEFGGSGRIWGTTEIKGTPNRPTKARVRLHRDRDGLLARETWSDSATGEFAFSGIDTTQKFTTLAEDAEGNFRPVAANRLTPEVLQ